MPKGSFAVLDNNSLRASFEVALAKCHQSLSISGIEYPALQYGSMEYNLAWLFSYKAQS